jgi:hypothetical protein
MITQKDINKDNIWEHFGSMNLILQIWGNVNTGNEDNEEWRVTADQYQPRRNRVWNGDFNDKEQFIINVKDTIERLKIGQQLLQDWLDGKIDDVYYWDLDQLNAD